MVSSTIYKLSSPANSNTETNISVTRGTGPDSPLAGTVTTTFSKGAGTTNEDVQILGADGVNRTFLALTRRDLSFGLSDAMKAGITTYDGHDQTGHRVCGAKVRITMQPSIVGTYILGEGGDGRSWEIDMFYSVPCSQGGSDMPIGHATFISAEIQQQFQLSISGDPIIFNKGHAVTIVGGPLAQLAGGWWDRNLAIIAIAKRVGELVHELSTSKTPWLGFDPGAQYAGTQLVYSAGDADAQNLKRFLLNQQSAYEVHIRRTPSDPWTVLTVVPSYLTPWNDLAQSWKLFQGDDLPDINTLVDSHGLPTLGDDGLPNANLQAIETSGCQNCPQPGLSRVVIYNGPNSPAYSAAFTNWFGAKSSLVLMGRGLQNDPSQVMNGVPTPTVQDNGDGTVQCPTGTNTDGTTVTTTKMTDGQCQDWLKKAAFWRIVTGDPHKLGADVVGQFNVENDSTYSSTCTGSGSTTSCQLNLDVEAITAAYQFDDNGPKLWKAWSALQAQGPVGAGALGWNYASQPYGGSGLMFTMLQNIMRTWYQQGDATSSPWMIFALDGGPALTIPGQIDRTLTELGH